MVFDVERDAEMRQQMAAEKERLLEHLGEAGDEEEAEEGDVATSDPGHTGRKGGSR